MAKIEEYASENFYHTNKTEVVKKRNKWLNETLENARKEYRTVSSTYTYAKFQVSANGGLWETSASVSVDKDSKKEQAVTGEHTQRVMASMGNGTDLSF